MRVLAVICFLATGLAACGRERVPCTDELVGKKVDTLPMIECEYMNETQLQADPCGLTDFELRCVSTLEADEDPEAECEPDVCEIECHAIVDPAAGTIACAGRSEYD